MSKEVANEWFVAAEGDLKFADLGIREKQALPQIAFLSQQAAEKLLKGFLYHKEIKAPRTHDLLRLLQEIVKIDAALEVIRSDCELLTGFYIDSRYPPDIPSFSMQELMEAFACAERIMTAVFEAVGRKKDFRRQ